MFAKAKGSACNHRNLEASGVWWVWAGGSTSWVGRWWAELEGDEGLVRIEGLFRIIPRDVLPRDDQPDQNRLVSRKPRPCLDSPAIRYGRGHRICERSFPNQQAVVEYDSEEWTLCFNWIWLQVGLSFSNSRGPVHGSATNVELLSGTIGEFAGFLNCVIMMRSAGWWTIGTSARRQSRRSNAHQLYIVPYEVRSILSRKSWGSIGWVFVCLMSLPWWAPDRWLLLRPDHWGVSPLGPNKLGFVCLRWFL